MTTVTIIGAGLGGVALLANLGLALHVADSIKKNLANLFD